MTQATKTCSKCSAVKPTSEFYPRGDRPNALRSACKTCTNGGNARYYAATLKESRRLRKDEINAARNARRRANPERYRAVERAWYKANPDLIARNRRRDYLKHRAKRISAILARQRGMVGPGVHWEDLWKRDGPACWLCGRDTDRSLPYNHRYYPSTDHVIPVSRGGLHSPDNARLAHRYCNDSRGAPPLV